MMTNINFAASKDEFLVAKQIAARAIGMQLVRTDDLLSVTMDILATHNNGCPLRLLALADADDMNFGHDVGGIRRYLDRETGQLTDCFVPRFAA